jgi:hypothetical protein
MHGHMNVKKTAVIYSGEIYMKLDLMAKFHDVDIRLSTYKSVSHEMQHLTVYILFHAGFLYMFRVLFAPIIRST